MERSRCLQADDLVGKFAERCNGVGWSNRCRHHYVGRIDLSQRSQRRLEGRAGRDAVVDDDRNLPFESWCISPSTESDLSVAHLAMLSPLEYFMAGLKTLAGVT